VKNIIIDTDTGSDDAVALVMALRDPSVKVLAVTTVFGNVDLETATQNALISINQAGTYQPPLYKGLAKPLVSEFEPVSDIEDFDNFSKMGFSSSKQLPETEHAVDALIRLIKDGDGSIELVTLGPLANVAMAMIQSPEVMKKLPRITIMGGAHFYTNAHTAMAEYNIMADPEAADVVFQFGVPITLVTLEACQENSAPLDKQEIARFREAGSAARFCMDCSQVELGLLDSSVAFPNLELPDPVAYAVFSKPELAKTVFDSQTIIELGGTYSRGTTIFRTRVGFFETVPLEVNSRVVTEVDGRAFKDFMFGLLKD
jgi:purine nucleosidase